MWRPLLTLLLLYSAWTPSGAQDYDLEPEPLIVGGTVADISEFPFQAAVEYLEEFSCSSTIISSTWVLTAANCILYTIMDNTRIRVGSSILETGGTVHQVSQGLYHTYYDPFNTDYNIAVMQVTEFFVFGDLVQPVALAVQGYDPPEGTELTVVGWGARNDSYYMDGQLYMGTTTVLDRTTCNNTGADMEEYPLRGNITDRMICSLQAEPCWNDAGGPLLFDGETQLIQVGIISVFPGYCYEENYPINSVSIGSLRSWIDDVIGI